MGTKSPTANATSSTQAINQTVAHTKLADFIRRSEAAGLPQTRHIASNPAYRGWRRSARNRHFRLRPSKVELKANRKLNANRADNGRKANHRLTPASNLQYFLQTDTANSAGIMPVNEPNPPTAPIPRRQVGRAGQTVTIFGLGGEGVLRTHGRDAEAEADIDAMHAIFSVHRLIVVLPAAVRMPGDLYFVSRFGSPVPDIRVAGSASLVTPRVPVPSPARTARPMALLPGSREARGAAIARQSRGGTDRPCDREAAQLWTEWPGSEAGGAG